ncbi:MULTISPECIES: hypothetical protein [Anaerofustis]|uniref:hypothetical protein n=1 Tax=Anaerofustis TaxID=264995 RepID=UPI001485A927|nr:MULTISPECIES: hypothetical protein [Anaerofustis]MCO8193136.1 hypothetical protein [Anaerofustis sp. NSJ-163]
MEEYIKIITDELLKGFDLSHIYEDIIVILIIIITIMLIIKLIKIYITSLK